MTQAPQTVAETRAIPGGNPPLMAKREKITLHRATASVAPEAPTAGSLTLWFDARTLPADDQRAPLLQRLANLRYTGVMVAARQWSELQAALPRRLDLILNCEHIDELRALGDWNGGAGRTAIVASGDEAVLRVAKEQGLPTCLYAYVDDGDSLRDSIEAGSRHNYLMIRFRDPTNIPLELVIATLQPTATVLIKEIADADDLEDAVVSLGVMEVGADGVMYSPRSHDRLDQLSARLEQAHCAPLAIEVATILRSEPVGMGYRSCLDLATIFAPDEGMIVGSTSQGGFLCCPEVFFLPYMELRPFRVNAGAVHSYVYNFADRTDYMTELRAGTAVMVVGTDGRTRRATVGRTKTEVRPLRLIEAAFDDGRKVNVLMQDDWHVRIFGVDSQPRNITELKAGDKVLGFGAAPGRHVGIKVDEHIIEE